MDDVLFNMTDNTGAADIGDIFSFQVVVDLPKLPESTNITMEIFAINPVSGIGGFTLCDVTEVGKGTNVQPSDAAKINYEHKETHPTVVKITFFLGTSLIYSIFGS